MAKTTYRNPKETYIEGNPNISSERQVFPGNEVLDGICVPGALSTRTISADRKTEQHVSFYRERFPPHKGKDRLQVLTLTTQPNGQIDIEFSADILKTVKVSSVTGNINGHPAGGFDEIGTPQRLIGSHKGVAHGPMAARQQGNTPQAVCIGMIPIQLGAIA